MTPEEKAIWLINTFGEHTENKDFFGDKTRYNMKACALICVDQFLSIGAFEPKKRDRNHPNERHREYWEQVKKEIENGY